jgi:molybdopterin synthase catalytic subunit
MSEHKERNIFIQGPIMPSFIAESISKHNTKTAIGGHSIFLGQVRSDEVEGRKVAAIEYTTYEEMALKRMTEIRESIFAAYPLICMHVYHSLGVVKTGEICLFVFTSSKHRKAAIEACNTCVESIKENLPIWGKEIFEDESYQWKVNQ